jgi:hypothetical protein
MCARYVFLHISSEDMREHHVHGLVEDSSLPGSDTVSLGDWLLTLAVIRMTATLGIESYTFLTMI